jgi:hypothetical protein
MYIHLCKYTHLRIYDYTYLSPYPKADPKVPVTKKNPLITLRWTVSFFLLMSANRNNIPPMWMDSSIWIDPKTYIHIIVVKISLGYIYMYQYMYTYIYSCMYMYKYIHIYTCTYIYIYTHIYVSIYVYRDTYEFADLVLHRSIWARRSSPPPTPPLLGTY